MKRIRQDVWPDLHRHVAKAEEAVKTREDTVDTHKKARAILFKSDSFKGSPFSSPRTRRGSVSSTALSGRDYPASLDRPGSRRGSILFAK